MFTVRPGFRSVRRFTESVGPSEREPSRRIARRKFPASIPASKFNMKEHFYVCHGCFEIPQVSFAFEFDSEQPNVNSTV